MRRLAAIAALVLSALPALAQDNDPMAQQRCVWACLANSPGAASAEYNACVAQQCAQIGTETAGPAQEAWTFGIASDQLTRFAGIGLGDGSGRGFYYMCTPGAGGQSYLVLYGFANPGGYFKLAADATRFTVPFDRSRGQLTAPLLRNAAILGRIGSARTLTVRDGQDNLIVQVPLAGAGAALQSAVGACGG